MKKNFYFKKFKKKKKNLFKIKLLLHDRPIKTFEKIKIYKRK